MFDPGGPVPGALAVRAWSTRGGVAVSWPEGALQPAALSAAVEQFCRALAGTEQSGGPEASTQLRYVELQVTDGQGHPGPHEPTAAERTSGAAVGPDTDAAPGPMIVHAFALTPELVEDDPGQPPGPGRPWAEFRRALIDEAVRRRPA